MSRLLSSFCKKIQIKILSAKRKLDFKKMMHLIISMESGCLNHELLKFFEYDSSLPTGSAFLSTTFPNFPFLHSVTFLRNLTLNSLRKFRGKYYLVRVMVLNLTLPEILTILTPSTSLMGKSLSGFNMVHTISLYEVCSKRYLDLEFSLGVLKMSFRLSAILWIGMPMGGSPFSLLTEDFPVTMFLPMQSKIMLIFLIRAKV